MKEEYIHHKYVDHLFLPPHKNRKGPVARLRQGPDMPTPYEHTSGESEGDPEVEETGTRQPTPTPSVSSTTSDYRTHRRRHTLDQQIKQWISSHDLPLKKLNVIKFAKKKMRKVGRSHDMPHSGELQDSDEEALSKSMLELSKLDSPSKTSKHPAHSTQTLPMLENKTRFASSVPTTPVRERLTPVSRPSPIPPPKPPRAKKRVKSMEKDPLYEPESAAPLLGSEGEDKPDSLCDFSDLLEEFDRSCRMLSDTRSVSTGDLSNIGDINIGMPAMGAHSTSPRRSRTANKRLGSKPDSPDSSPLANSMRSSKFTQSSPGELKQRSSSFTSSSDMRKVFKTSPRQQPRLVPPRPLDAVQNGSASPKEIRAAKRLSSIASDSGSSEEPCSQDLTPRNDLDQPTRDLSLQDLHVDIVELPEQEVELQDDVSQDSSHIAKEGNLLPASPSQSEISTDERPLPEEPVSMPFDRDPDIVRVGLWVGWWRRSCGWGCGVLEARVLKVCSGT